MTTDPAALAKLAVETCESRKAEKVILYGMLGKSVLADYYLICSGQSEPQLNAIAGALHQMFGEHGLKPKSVQGTAQSHWIIMDYGFILVHIFTPECRDFYKIEQLWPKEDILHETKPEVRPKFVDANWSHKA